jgi:GDP-L-fucose synthase
MNKTPKIYVAGHRGMVGSAIIRKLQEDRSNNIVFRSHGELDLTNQDAVNFFFEKERPDHVYLAAAKVGGIYANNTYPADFIYENLMIQTNIIHAAWKYGVSKLLFLGSSCIYPKIAEQPISEAALLTGSLESTNEPYAIAKISGIKLCESYNRQYGVDFRSVMPCNLYGPGDNYHLENSHVIPALIRRFHEAKVLGKKEVIIWGTGTPKREFLYVDDMATASVHVMNLDKSVYAKNTLPMQNHINVGYGADVTIANLAQAISEAVEYYGDIKFDNNKPDGTPTKLMNTELINLLGWNPQVNLKEGLKKTYKDFMMHIDTLRME